MFLMTQCAFAQADSTFVRVPKYVVDFSTMVIVYPNPDINDPLNHGGKVYKGRAFNPDGHNRIYNEHDKLWIDAVYKNGSLLFGRVYEYKAGTVSRIKVYKEGKHHSDAELSN